VNSSTESESSHSPDAHQNLHANQNEEDLTARIDRLLFFSDAIFAIILTLIALELKLPGRCKTSMINGAGETCWSDAWTALDAIHVALVSYVSSFLIVAVAWATHHAALTARLRAFDYGVVWRNAVFLMLLGLIPFSTRAINEYPRESWVSLLYGTTIALSAVAFVWLWTYVAGKKSALLRPGTVTASEYRGHLIGAAFLIPIGVFCNLYVVFDNLPADGAEAIWLLVAVSAVQVQIMGKHFDTKSLSGFIFPAILFGWLAFWVDTGDARRFLVIHFHAMDNILYILPLIPMLLIVGLLLVKIIWSDPPASVRQVHYPVPLAALENALGRVRDGLRDTTEQLAQAQDSVQQLQDNQRQWEDLPLLVKLFRGVLKAVTDKRRSP